MRAYSISACPRRQSPRAVLSCADHSDHGRRHTSRTARPNLKKCQLSKPGHGSRKEIKRDRRPRRLRNDSDSDGITVPNFVAAVPKIVP